ncbi:hypothetical protein [Cytobacillus sp. IB215316]|uniref:hypothetical protein n=1 Tax=Cytobacillus sp. IB215316 TaxID=3097354 RepID=UPI002A131F22|nr:hypothetical protein [Cytobacillus sp. IB215316]MDX8360186.1 hypothetical protein [Cytobacillus sp. IB215316]
MFNPKGNCDPSAYHYQIIYNSPPCLNDYHINHTSRHPFNNRQFPPVDTTMFSKSAKEMQKLMSEAALVLNKIAYSKEFAHQVMTAAQESQLNKVEQLIKSTGITSEVECSFNPDGITITFILATSEIDCCHLSIILRWRS